MTTYFVDHAGSNTAPYDTQAKAAPTLATILAIPPAAGDIIYCCDNAGTGEVIASGLALASSGTNAAGWIKLIGCNSSGVVDGTRYVIDANGGSFNILDTAGNDLIWFQNIEVKNTGSGNYNGFICSTGSSNGCVFINCCANTCGAAGFFSYAFDFTYFIMCVAYSNTGPGWSSGFDKYFFCVSRNNSDGWYGVRAHLWYGCVAYDNTDDGIDNTVGCIMNCVIPGTGSGDDGIYNPGHTTLNPMVLIANRITNHSGAGDVGLYTGNEPTLAGWNYFENNDDESVQGSAGSSPNATYQFIPNSDGTNTNVNETTDTVTDTDYGYLDATNFDFSTKYVDADDPTLRRKAITLPWS